MGLQIAFSPLVDDLVQKNDDKERAIKKLETEFNDIKGYDQDNYDDVVEEEIELDDLTIDSLSQGFLWL